MDSQEFESYVPVYDFIPDDWEEARPALVEQLKKISNAVNVREIGWYLDEELLSGKAFFPSVVSNPPQFRSIFRKVVDCSPLIIGVNSFAHGIDIDSNFSLIDLWCSATDSVGFTGTIFCNEDTINYDVTDINITSAAAYDRAYAVIEYIQEV